MMVLIGYLVQVRAGGLLHYVGMFVKCIPNRDEMVLWFKRLYIYLQVSWSVLGTVAEWVETK